MTLYAACWGLGYAAIWCAVAAYGWHSIQHYRKRDRSLVWPTATALQWTGHLLSAASTILIWLGLWLRAQRGHGWPIVSSADAAGVVALILLVIHTLWAFLSPKYQSGTLVTLTVLALMSYTLGQFPDGLIALPLTNKASLVSEALNLCGASLLGLAAAASVTDTLRRCLSQSEFSESNLEEQASEVLVRIALLCLAASLAIDTWWLQRVGFGGSGDAQQAGIAIAWMIYFVALRLRDSARWRGWPWASVLTVGFFCILPILLDVPWLEATLHV